MASLDTALYLSREYDARVTDLSRRAHALTGKPRTDCRRVVSAYVEAFGLDNTEAYIAEHEARAALTPAA